MNFVFCWEAAISVYVVLSSSGLRETFRVGRLHNREKKECENFDSFLLKSGGGAMVVLPLPPPAHSHPPPPPPPKKKKKKKKGEKGEEGEGGETCLNGL